MRKRETKIFVPFCSVPTRCVIENSIKIEKNSKKKKKYDYGSFQAKIGRKRMRNMENKNYHFVSFLPDAQKKIPKKFKKLKNTIMNSFQPKIGWKKMRKREIKIIVPFRSFPTRCVIENSKQIAKKFKKLKNTIEIGRAHV